jgi:hypothetical protein
VYGNTIYYFENLVWFGCLGVCVRNILVRGLELGFGLGEEKHLSECEK